MRPLCLDAALAVALAGYGSSDAPAESNAMRGGSVDELEQAAAALGEKLKTLGWKDARPTIRVERPTNMTDRSLDTMSLEEPAARGPSEHRLRPHDENHEPEDALVVRARRDRPLRLRDHEARVA
jgi:hypothetical protein